ncbi:TolB family protein [Cellulomonas sp.]|uniref:TolB family protein n=1 Tax=Cellulomonas sp. TaxID=40001 RepID=UPI003BAA627E
MTAAAARWRVRPDDAAPLWPTSQPVALVVREPSPDGLGLWIDTEPRSHRFLGWSPGSSLLTVMADVPGVDGEGNPILCAGGHAVLVELARCMADDGGRFVEVVDRGVARVDLRTGAVARVELEPLPFSSLVRTAFAGSPDGASVAMLGPRVRPPARGSATPPRGGETRPTELSVARFDGTTPRRFDVYEDLVLSEWNPDDVGVQWSPDGTRIACAVSWNEGPAQGPARFRRETVIYTAADGAEVQRIPGNLCGSASWSADSNYLLVDHDLDDTWIHDLTRDTCRPVLVLPPSGTRDMRPVRALGLADDDYLVTARHRGERMTIALTRVDDGATTAILSWNELEARYPKIASLPCRTWLAAAQEVTP